jgi:glycosyltransferase involved in cell wall biosynthesis
MQWVAAADVVLVPQRDGPVGRAQVPAKLSDALAMGRAIVATDLAPIRAVIGGAALLVPPDDQAAIASAVRRVLSDPALRTALEYAARDRFQRTLSFAAIRPTALQVVKSASRRPNSV